jgi:hypothetical protein
MKKLLFVLFCLFPSIACAALNLTNSSTITYAKTATTWNVSVVNASHSHDAGNITSGTLAIAQGGVSSGNRTAWDNKVTESTTVSNTSDINLTLSTYAISAALNSTLKAKYDGVAANNHTAVTLAGSNYITLSGQQITAGDVALLSNTSGNYVASVATTLPLTGGAAGSEGAALTVALPKATAAADGYLNMTDFSTFASKGVSNFTGVQVQNNSATPYNNSVVNLIPGSGLAFTVTNATYGVNVTIASTAGGGNVSQLGAITANNVTTWQGTNGVQDGGKTVASLLTVVASANITDYTITGIDIANETINATTIANFTVEGADIKNETINSSQITNYTIDGADIKNATINGTTIADYSVAAADMANFTVTGQQIANGTINATQLASANKVKHTTKTIYNITSSFDGVIDRVDTVSNITEVWALTEGGTNVTFMIEKCLQNGTACVKCNATDWIAASGIPLDITAFSNATLAVNETIKINTTSAGTVPWFTVKVYRQE